MTIGNIKFAQYINNNRITLGNLKSGERREVSFAVVFNQNGKLDVLDNYLGCIIPMEIDIYYKNITGDLYYHDINLFCTFQESYTDLCELKEFTYNVELGIYNSQPELIEE